ncbi:hypothetical protein F7731_15475 [Cytobacillus depressus]|uniref:Calcineurin-like phosphoesterase domain-containing protein n=1 Tax=Cytobacillus depressus TaxID=1602942 RepID=A0A6L3V4U6_9BACI|nr:hypothetical protein F7731_15475 [Cytobacillus depressus]
MKIMFQFFLIINMILIALHRTNAQDLTESNIRLRILETTDLHAHILGYDYKKNKPRLKFGLSRVASLIKNARLEEPNSLLFDVGDVLVGSELDEYVYKSHYLKLHEKLVPLGTLEPLTHPVIKAMNALHYDAATVGNHEFNHGLEFLYESIRGAQFPYVNANIYIDDQNNIDNDDLNYFNPFTILEREFTDSKGNKQQIKVGVIGFLTPIAAEWDKRYFKGRLKIKNIKDTAEHFIPIMKDNGADIIIALAHVGLQADKGLKDRKRNSVYALSEVKGIDAVLYGHSHSLFPMKGTKEGNGSAPSTIRGVPAVQAGYWGNHLGIIELQLSKVNGNWVVKSSQSVVKPIYRTIKNKIIPVVKEDLEILKVMELDHKEVIKYFHRQKKSKSQ